MATITHYKSSDLGGSAGSPPSYPSAAMVIVPSDTDIHEPPITIFIGTMGDVAIVPASGAGTAVTFKSLPAGSTLPCLAKKVMATNTTATNLVAIT